MWGRLQTPQASSHSRGLLLGRVGVDHANTYLRGIFSRSVGDEIGCQVCEIVPVDAARIHIHQEMLPVASAKKFQATPVPRVHHVAGKHDDRIRRLRMADDEVSAGLKKQHPAGQKEENKNNIESSHFEQREGV